MPGGASHCRQARSLLNLTGRHRRLGRRGAERTEDIPQHEMRTVPMGHAVCRDDANGGIASVGNDFPDSFIQRREMTPIGSLAGVRAFPSKAGCTLSCRCQHLLPTQCASERTCMKKSHLSLARSCRVILVLTRIDRSYRSPNSASDRGGRPIVWPTRNTRSWRTIGCTYCRHRVARRDGALTWIKVLARGGSPATGEGC